MIMRIQRLDWDSEFFGLEIGKLGLDKFETDKDLRFGQFDLVYVFSDFPLEDKQVQKQRLRLVDKKITFEYEVGSETTEDLSQQISSYFSGNDDKIVALGIQSGIHSRFRIDPHFKEGSFEKLYTTWMRRSIERQIADEVLAYHINNEIAGVITLKLSSPKVIIGILAVDTAHRGKKIGRQLVDAARSFCKQNNASILEVATQLANKEACKFYERCGFEIQKTEYIYHYWNHKI
jgi:dTDP-4-amino-4,6-dideoxy-D-galactose acyltransferase